MRIVVKKAGQYPEIKDIPNELSAFQEIVGGHIETVLMTNDPIICVCNDEGKLQGLEPNFILFDDVIVGDVFFCGTNEEDFESLTDTQVRWLLDVFTSVEIAKTRKEKSEHDR